MSDRASREGEAANADALTNGVAPLDVLILGGTSQARLLATHLADAGFNVITSLAGRTDSAPIITGGVRTGGFGGTAGLIDWLVRNRPHAVIDATHAFAATMSEHAAHACQATDTPLARFSTPSWHRLPAAQHWVWVPSHQRAAAEVARLPGPVLLSVGRQSIAHYLALGERDVTARMITPPDVPLPASWTLLCRRGPFSMATEQALLDAPGHRIAVLVSKDSGGPSLDAKLVVAEQIGATIIMIDRPASPAFGEPTWTLDETLAWVRTALG